MFELGTTSETVDEIVEEVIVEETVSTEMVVSETMETFNRTAYILQLAALCTCAASQLL